jgi:hypothetical protein
MAIRVISVGRAWGIGVERIRALADFAGIGALHEIRASNKRAVVAAGTRWRMRVERVMPSVFTVVSMGQRAPAATTARATNPEAVVPAGAARLNAATTVLAVGNAAFACAGAVLGIAVADAVALMLVETMAVQTSRPKSAAKAFRLCGVMSAPYSSMSQVGLMIVRTLGDTVLR